MLAWLSAWSEVQICIWPSWCHCHSLSLASVKSRLVLPFWYRPTRVVPEKAPLNGCVCVLFVVNMMFSVLGSHLCCLTLCVSHPFGQIETSECAKKIVSTHSVDATVDRRKYYCRAVIFVVYVELMAEWETFVTCGSVNGWLFVHSMNLNIFTVFVHMGNGVFHFFVQTYLVMIHRSKNPRNYS